jgi:hypothetical protein
MVRLAVQVVLDCHHLYQVLQLIMQVVEVAVGIIYLQGVQVDWVVVDRDNLPTLLLLVVPELTLLAAVVALLVLDIMVVPVVPES